MRTLAKDVQVGIFFAILTAGLFIGGFEAGSRYERRKPDIRVVSLLPTTCLVGQVFVYSGMEYICADVPKESRLGQPDPFVTPSDTLADEARKDLRKPKPVPTKKK